MGLFTLRRISKWAPPTFLDQLLLSPLTFIITLIHHISTRLRGAPFSAPENKPHIKIVCISDTHGHQPHVPPGDLLIHAGDMTNSGRKEDIQNQVDWMNTLPHKHIVVVAGNHDNYLDPSSQERMQERRGSTTKGQWSGKGIKWGRLTYLHHTSVTLMFKGRHIDVYGAPGIPRIDGTHAFEYTQEDAPWNENRTPIPPSCDILVTHTPPAGHLDIGLGCPSLLKQVWICKPRLHVFGHVHSGAGREAVFWDPAQAALERLRAQDAVYEQGDKVRPGFWRDVKVERWMDAGRVVWFGMRNVIWRWLMQGSRGANGGLLVNAALTYRNTGRIGNEPQIVYL